MSLDDQLRAELAAIDAAGLRRQLRPFVGPQGPTVSLDGREVLNFSSNLYLGLASHPALLAAGRLALDQGAGAGASRLITGNLPAHRALEADLAAAHGQEAALLFNSGYQANLGILQALAGPEDIIFSDALNHASLIDGCRLSRATISVYRHADPADLHERLTTSGSFRRRFVVTDTIFSMDGTIAPLPALAAVARRHGAHLVVDEAHATGVLGPGGRGAAAAAGVIPDVHVATLGKGLGTFGAYATGSRALIDVLLHRARSFVFTTALPPAVAETSRAAVAIAFGAEGETLRAALASRMDELRAGLDGLGLLAPGAGHTPIFPILIGDPRRALAATAALLERGIFLQAIRPPTVPRGTSRLRMSLMATHTEDHIAAALAALSDLRREGLL